jgi:2-hydroxychromene-2-carboxylate isomerase
VDGRPILTGVLVLHFDYPSPTSAVALVRLQRIADEGGSVAFSGFDALGLDVSVPLTLDQLAELERTQAAAREFGLTLRRPTRRPPTVLAHVVSDLADTRGLGAAWRESCLAAYWRDDADLGDPEVLADLARGVGLDDAEVATWLADPRPRRAVRQRMVDARRAGVGAVPVLEADGALVPADLSETDLRALAAL